MMIALGFRCTSKAQVVEAASNNWTVLNNEIVMNDVDANTVTFSDTVDAGWAQMYYTGAVYNEELDVRSYIYDVTLSTSELTSNGSLYFTISNNLSSPWDSYNWSVGAFLLQVDYWGKFNWDADYRGAVRFSAQATTGVEVTGNPVDAYFGDGAIKISFDVKPNGTIVRINDNVAFEAVNMTSRNTFDWWSRYGAALSVGPQGTRLSTTSYNIAVSKVSRVANVRVDGTGKVLSSLPNGGFRITDTENVGWYDHALYQGVVYDDIIDTTQEIEVTVKSVTPGSNNNIYIVLCNSLTLPYSNAYWYPSFVGIGIQYWGGWERVYPLNSSGSDPAASNYYDSASLDSTGLTVKFVVNATSTDVYLDGVLKCSLANGADYFQWYGNKAQLQFGGYEQRSTAFGYDVVVNSSAANDVYAVEHFVENYMHEEVNQDQTGSGQCISAAWFDTAKAAYLALTQAQRDIFANGSGAYTAYYNRLSAWANANNSTLSNEGITINQLDVEDSQDMNAIMVIVVSVSSVSIVLTMLLFLKKKKRRAK